MLSARLQSFADRVVFDSATVLYVASGVSPVQADRCAEPGGWTVRQVLGHVGSALRLHGAAIERLVAGEPPVPPGWDPGVMNAESAEQDAGLEVEAAAQRIRDGRREFLAALEKVTEPIAGKSFRGQSVDAILESWSRHCAGHAFDLIEALPQFRADPIAVSWALFLDPAGDARMFERQRRLFRELQDRLPREREEE